MQSSFRSSAGQGSELRSDSGAIHASIIILNWNGRRWLDACLSSVAALDPPAAEVIVVDNASSDDSVEFVRRAYPAVRLAVLPANVGFAAGNNAGARMSSQSCLVFLNNDTRVEPDWLGRLAEAASADSGIDLVTSRIMFMDDPQIVDSAGDGYLRCGGAFKHGHGRPIDANEGSREVFGACGAAFLIRRDLFEAIEGFDEDFFMVYEDVDLSYRARLRGARCAYAADATVWHAGSASIGRVSARTVYHGQRNLEWTWIKNTPSRLVWRSCLAHAAYDLAAAAAYARRGQLGVWCRAKLAAVAGLPQMLKKRRVVQRSVTVAATDLWQLMEPDWIGVKRREKEFDFGRFSRKDK